MSTQIPTQLLGKLDIKKLSVSKISQNKNNSGKQMYVNYDNKPFKIQAGPYTSVLGIREGEYLGNQTYSTFVSIKDDSEFEKLEQVHERILELAVAEMQADAAKNKKKANFSVSQADNGPFRSSEEYGNSMNLRFNPAPDGKFWCSLFDTKNKELSFTSGNCSEFVTPGSEISTVFGLVVYCVGSKFGVSWRPNCVKIVKEGSSSLPKNLFVDESGEPEVAESPSAPNNSDAESEPEPEQKDTADDQDSETESVSEELKELVVTPSKKRRNAVHV